MLPNAEIGLGYYLYPDFGTMQKLECRNVYLQLFPLSLQ